MLLPTPEAEGKTLLLTVFKPIGHPVFQKVLQKSVLPSPTTACPRIYASLAAGAMTAASPPWSFRAAATASYQKTPDHSSAQSFCGLCTAWKVRVQPVSTVLHPSLSVLSTWHHPVAALPSFELLALSDLRSEDPCFLPLSLSLPGSISFLMPSTPKPPEHSQTAISDAIKCRPSGRQSSQCIALDLTDF